MSTQLKIARPFTTLGVLLSCGRKRAGLTQREMSIKLKYTSAQHISNFERGMSVPPLKKLNVLVKTYGLNSKKVIATILQAKRERIHEALNN